MKKLSENDSLSVCLTVSKLEHWSSDFGLGLRLESIPHLSGSRTSRLRLELTSMALLGFQHTDCISWDFLAFVMA